ncbi:hypothetical protein [Streptomyces sp. NPDC003077]|uniref:hypothetical protein n=1 Tax=Streptomyces sp. NPDC003077 TaxID=3154443 RepID=UPI00339F8E1B
MTIAVYQVGPDGERSDLRSVLVRADDPEGIENGSPVYPPCRCPRHREQDGTAGEGDARTD